MINLKLPIILATFGGVILSTSYIYKRQQPENTFTNRNTTITPQKNQTDQLDDNPLSIKTMRKKSYQGSDLKIEEELPPVSNYNQYIASYKSDGLTIYGLLTVPESIPPLEGWPVIIFNHGYIPPETYKTTERYVAYVAAFARNGYIIFKPDFRGNGDSQGQPEGAYYSPAYATDALNAISTLKQFKGANPNKIGLWGHSMGGNITLRAVVVDSKDIRAAVIWSGVVGSYDGLMNNWQRKVRYQPPAREIELRNNYRKRLTDTYGTPENNPVFWQAIDPTDHLTEISTPIQLHTGGNDEEVPISFSESLKEKLTKADKVVEYYNYPGGDHNISSPNFELAMQRSIEFFNRYLKGGERL